MLIFVGTGLAVIPWLTMVSVIAPIVVGAILGNLDDDLREFFGSHEPIIVPFMAFTLGQTINLKSVVTAGLPGVALGLTVVMVTGAVCILADRLLGGSGVAGAAASSTAGNSAAVPQAVALADPSFAAVAPAATVQVAASVIVTAIMHAAPHRVVVPEGRASAPGRQPWKPVNRLKGGETRGKVASTRFLSLHTPCTCLRTPDCSAIQLLFKGVAQRREPAERRIAARQTADQPRPAPRSGLEPEPRRPRRPVRRSGGIPCERCCDTRPRPSSRDRTRRRPSRHRTTPAHRT